MKKGPLLTEYFYIVYVEPVLKVINEILEI